MRKARCCDPSAGRFGVKEDMLNIQLCTEFGCPQWAQWRVTTPEIDEDGKPTGKLTLVGLVCGPHKELLSEVAHDLDLRFSFAGAVIRGPQPS